MVCHVVILILSTLFYCQSASGQAAYQRRYEIEENTGDESYPYQRTILAPRSAQDQSQFNNPNQYHQLNQLHQLQQLNQKQNPISAQQGTHQYLTALQQYYAAAKKPQNIPAAAPASAFTQFPNQPQTQQAPQQAAYSHPLGVLYSAATDVSQFQFSGNGVSYSF